MAEAGDIARLCDAYRAGDSEAFDRMVALAYGQLRTIARRHLGRHRRSPDLDTTGLVHEVYLKLARQSGLELADSGHFLAVSARAMKQVIVQFARSRNAAKRGGGGRPETLDEESPGVSVQAEQVLDVNRALERLAERDERLARVVECRYFAGLSEEETAQALGVSLRTAQRDWLRARAWLRLELAASKPTVA